MKRLGLFLLASSLIAGLPACGDDADGADGAADSGTSGGGHHDAGSDPTDAGSVGSVSEAITAADGGEVVLGAASLSIPAGALAADTTITLETSTPGSDLPDAASVKGLIYAFGPDGTQFSPAAKLVLPLVDEPSADEEAVISWLDEESNTWQDLPTTVEGDGSLSADVMHFTRFAVRFNGVVSSDCGFNPCGGDIVGTWMITGVCAEISDPVIDVCPTALAQLDLMLTGTATFNSDGTRSDTHTGKSTITYMLDAACLDSITSGMPPATCDALSKPADPATGDGPTTCSGDPAVACTCVQDNPESTETKTGTYVVDGSMVTTTQDADGTVEVAEFCVQGSQARLQQLDGLAVLTWIATKQ